jgi:formate dehydrogenase assembly factor FdhD
MTMQPAARWDITTVREGEIARCSDLLVQETRRTVRVNGRVAASVACSPGGARNHGLGYLLTEGFLAPGEMPESMEIDGEDVSALVERQTAPPPEPVVSDLVVRIPDILDMAAAAAFGANLHTTTGGTHSAALFLGDAHVAQAEDISRSAAFEKAVGAAMADGIPLDRTVLFLTSRVPEGFVVKAAHARIPILAAVSAPTLQAAQTAGRLGICLCAFVRGSRANIYSCPWRTGS